MSRPDPHDSPTADIEHGSSKNELEPYEEWKAIEEESLNAAVTHETIRREGVKELNRTPGALALSGLAGGLSMGLSILAMAALHHGLPETTWRPLVVALGYPLGFLVVTLGSQQLFTENTLTPIVPLMAERTGEMVRKVAMLWTVVLLANLAGTFLFGWAAAQTTILPAEVARAMHTLALESLSPGPLDVFARGIVGGWIIALLVWMLPGASSSKVAVIVIMTWVLGAAKLSHVIVGATEMFHLTMLGEISIGRAFAGYILPALAGNVLGGVGLVAVINHGQVEAE